MAGIVPPKVPKRLPTYMKLEELQQLLRSLESETGPLALRNQLMFTLLATTGFRRQELVDLNWGHLDLENQTVRVLGKGNKERLLPFHPIVLPLFHTYRETRQEFQRHPSQPVFLNRNGLRLDPRGLHLIFKQELKKAGLPPARFSLLHLRHTFATLMLQNNAQKVDLRTLQELLGHENLTTVSVYTHVDFTTKKEAIEAFQIL
jgi:site-specific recombinase XerD